MSGFTLTGFQILSPLRQTSKTTTVKAIQTSLERTVAITLLRPEFTQDPKETRRFLSVARVCAQIKAEGLPQIYDINTLDNQPYVVMEEVDGLSLAELVSQNGPLPVALSIRVGITIGEALHQAWTQNHLIHRNLKPSEIRVDSRGTPKLTDFGRATVIRPDGSIDDDDAAGLIIGTPNFLSPEQAQGRTTLDCRTDIYALGATLYYMITGRIPFPDSDPETVIQKQLTEQILHPRNYRPDLPAPVCGLLTRLMMKAPEDRYTDWAEALGDMQLALKNQPLQRRETPPKGISTIAPPSAFANTKLPPAPDVPELRKLPSAAATPVARPASRPAPEPHPTFRKQQSASASLVRTALWLLLLAWLVVLGNDRLNNPLGLPLPSPLLPLDRWLETTPESAPVPAKPVPVAQPRPVPVRPTPAQPPKVTATAPTPPPEETAKPEPPPPPPPPKAAEPEPPRLSQTLPPDVTTKLIAALSHGNLADARALLSVNLPMDSTRLAEFRAALSAIPDPLKLAEQTLQAAKGRELSIQYMGRDRTIIPRRAENGELEADFVAAEGNRLVVLKLAKFTGEELLKLLPAQPDSPATHGAVCLVLLKANRKEDAAAHARSCGVLAPLFDAAVAALP